MTNFINNLPQVQMVAPGKPLETLVACTVARVAVIQLHIRFFGERPSSRDSCIATANSILATIQTLDVNTLGYVDPFVAVRLPTFAGCLRVPDRSVHRFSSRRCVRFSSVK